MSHVVTIKTEIKDLQAVKAACKRLGWEFREGQETFAWYGEWLDDYSGNDAAFNHGIKPEDYGKCQHAIRVPGAKYEIGLVKKGNAYVPVFDNWGTGGLRGLTAENGLKGFIQAYSAEKAKIELRRKGYCPTETTRADGSIIVTCNA